MIDPSFRKAAPPTARSALAIFRAATIYQSEVRSEEIYANRSAASILRRGPNNKTIREKDKSEQPCCDTLRARGFAITV